MDLGALFVIFAVIVLVSMYVSRPFFARQSAGPSLKPTGEQDHQASALLAERDRLLNTIQELDFDHALGKIPEEEYPLQRSALMQAGAEVLRRLDGLEKSQAAAAGTAEARLEAAVAARRALPEKNPEDDLESLIAARRQERAERPGGFCPRCGKPVQRDDRFCPKCGANLVP